MYMDLFILSLYILRRTFPVICYYTMRIEVKFTAVNHKPPNTFIIKLKIDICN